MVYQIDESSSGSRVASGFSASGEEGEAAAERDVLIAGLMADAGELQKQAHDLLKIKAELQSYTDSVSEEEANQVGQQSSQAMEAANKLAQLASELKHNPKRKIDRSQLSQLHLQAGQLLADGAQEAEDATVVEGRASEMKRESTQHSVNTKPDEKKSCKPKIQQKSKPKVVAQEAAPKHEKKEERASAPQHASHAPHSHWEEAKEVVSAGYHKVASATEKVIDVVKHSTPVVMAFSIGKSALSMGKKAFDAVCAAPAETMNAAKNLWSHLTGDDTHAPAPVSLRAAPSKIEAAKRAAQALHLPMIGGGLPHYPGMLLTPTPFSILAPTTQPMVGN